MKKIAYVFLLVFMLPMLHAQESETGKPRARDLGIPFDGTPGPLNAITDVPGGSVGYKTIIRGTGNLKSDTGPVRTGVTVILPTQNFTDMKVLPASVFSLTGMGEMSGAHFLQDYHMLYGPIGLTTTTSVGVVRDAIGEWLNQTYSRGDPIDFSFGLPVVGETWDGLLNDINGLHIHKAYLKQFEPTAPARFPKAMSAAVPAWFCMDLKGEAAQHHVLSKLRGSNTLSEFLCRRISAGAASL